MNVDFFQQEPKLKLFKLKSLLLPDNKLKYKKNNNKTERLYPKYKLKKGYTSLSLKSHNNFHNNNNIKNNSKKSLENSKKKLNKKNTILPYITKENQKKSKKYLINSINSIEGYNNYLKEKTNKAYLKMSRLLMEENLKRLSLPKYKKTKEQFIIKEKSKYLNENDISQVELYDEQDEHNGHNEKLKIEKKHKNKKSLFEKEQIKRIEKFKLSLKNNFRELENCEKKFDIVIDKTLKLFTDYKFTLSNLSNNES